jgi:hypothetical protein
MSMPCAAAVGMVLPRTLHLATVFAETMMHYRMTVHARMMPHARMMAEPC